MILLKKEPKFQQLGDLTTISGSVTYIENGGRKTIYYEIKNTKTEVSVKTGESPLLENKDSVLPEEEELHLLTTIAKQSKKKNIKNHLTLLHQEIINALAYHNSVKDDTLDMSLIENDFSAKTEPLYEPELIIADNMRKIRGGLKGKIYYVIRIKNDEVQGLKDSSIKLESSKSCSKQEIRFVLNALAEKYSNNAHRYKNMLKKAEKIWAHQAQEEYDNRLTEEFTKDPVQFLSNEEIVSGFDKINPITYQDNTGTTHAIYKSEGIVRHVVTNDPNPTFEVLEKQRIAKNNPTTWHKIKKACQKIFSFKKKEEIQPPRPYTNLKRDIRNLAVFGLTIEAIRQKQQEGAYSQIEAPQTPTQLATHISQNHTLFNLKLRKQLREQKRER